jgi:hypothetical protein
MLAESETKVIQIIPIWMPKPGMDGTRRWPVPDCESSGKGQRNGGKRGVDCKGSGSEPVRTISLCISIAWVEFWSPMHKYANMLLCVPQLIFRMRPIAASK